MKRLKGDQTGRGLPVVLSGPASHVRLTLLWIPLSLFPVIFFAHSTALRAQHAAGSDLENLGCAACHTTHTGDATEYNLRAAPMPEFEVQAPELGASSRSCLRCHGSGTMPGALSTLSQRPYSIGPSLVDDHPLGRRRDASLALPGSSLESTDREGFVAFEMIRNESVDCTDCHDPHDSSGDPVLKAGESATCAACHEVTVRETQSHTSIECSGCHRLHDGAGRLLTDERSDRMCGFCHLVGYPAPARVRDPSRLAAQSAVLAPMDETHNGDLAGGCLECHPVH